MKLPFHPSATVALLAAITLLAGCASPFKQFYSGETATTVNQIRPTIAVPTSPAVVVPTSNLTAELESRLQDGAFILGWSSWNGSDVGTAEQAREQAREVGASVVLWSYQYASTSTGVVPITTPTTSTTYDNGTVYGSYGSASWTGTTTTYGTRTNYVPYTVHRYNVSSVFLGSPLNPPRLGVMPRELTPPEQVAAGTTKGLMVLLVIRRSPAADAGLLPNDVLCRIGGDPVGSMPEFMNALERHGGKTVEVELRRGGQTITKSIPLNP